MQMKTYSEWLLEWEGRTNTTPIAFQGKTRFGRYIAQGNLVFDRDTDTLIRYEVPAASEARTPEAERAAKNDVDAKLYPLFGKTYEEIKPQLEKFAQPTLHSNFDKKTGRAYPDRQMRPVSF